MTADAALAPAARRPRARRGEGERLRDEILDAAQALLDETGHVDKVSIRMVADRVGRTSPSIYLHFPDKASLMFAVCERNFVDYEAVVAAEVGELHDPVERLMAVGRGYLRYALEQPEQFRVLFLGEPGGPTRPVNTLAELAQTPSMLLAYAALEAGRASGAVRADSEVGDQMLTLWALIHGIATLLVLRPEFDWPDPFAWLAQAMDTLLLGLAPR